MPNPGRRGCALVFAAALAALQCACAQQLSPRVHEVPRLLAEARAEGLPADDPLALSDDIKASVAKHVRASGSARERIRLLEDYLESRVRFEYASNRTLTATEAWRAGRGDCMAFTNLFVALARHVGLNAYFVHVREVQDYYERSGRFFVSSHVAVGFGSGPDARVIDFSRELSAWRDMSDWRLAAYKTIRDVEAVALYYSNTAVDRMLAGASDDAERLFRFWLGRAPTVAELHNNLGVLLNRQRRFDESLSLLEGALRDFPTFKPLYTNAIVAARGGGQLARAQELVRRGEALEQDDPFFRVVHGLTLYQMEDYRGAVRELERARSDRPESVAILAWLTRAHYRAGQSSRGAETFAAVQRLAPRSPIVQQLVSEFPHLARRGDGNPEPRESERK
ncbi:tetratricopeptide repeat protein [Chondromyces crocatus]|uniref:Transglutaminase-like domain-containing protein n=1 Tax=Chondromyces crocatus TaxID=52 RepID=A0A0K1EJM1_CHOCO|nr:tetratricopeptide repeat protein [Chondromyces crocatus]AKT40882.1 uncharacterized protein CMC5_050390 [Chondromyces crocatus]